MTGLPWSSTSCIAMWVMKRSGAALAEADAIATVEQKAKDLLAQADAYRELSSNLAHDDA